MEKDHRPIQVKKSERGFLLMVPSKTAPQKLDVLEVDKDGWRTKGKASPSQVNSAFLPGRNASPRIQNHINWCWATAAIIVGTEYCLRYGIQPHWG